MPGGGIARNPDSRRVRRPCSDVLVHVVAVLNSAAVSIIKAGSVERWTIMPAELARDYSSARAAGVSANLDRPSTVAHQREIERTSELTRTIAAIREWRCARQNSLPKAHSRMQYTQP